MSQSTSFVDDGGVAEDEHVVAAEVAGEEEAFFSFEEVDGDEGGAEEVTGVVEGGDDAGEDFDILFIWRGFEALHGGVYVVEAVERLEEVLALARTFLVDVFDVFDLEVCGVAEHDVAQVYGGGCREDVAAEAIAYEGGDVSAVVDMGVAEEYLVDRGGVEGEVAVAFEGFLALALHESAVEEDARIVDFEQVH